MRKTIWFNDFFIESPKGEKVLIHALNAYAPNFRDDGVLALKRRDEKWYGQLVDAAAELGECKTFIDAKFDPKVFLETLKSKGFKVYWEGENNIEIRTCPRCGSKEVHEVICKGENTDHPEQAFKELDLYPIRPCMEFECQECRPKYRWENPAYVEYLLHRNVKEIKSNAKGQDQI